jgi:hypothetical protein
VIDRRYSLDDIAEAFRYAEAGHKQGHVVINIAPAYSVCGASAGGVPHHFGPRCFRISSVRPFHSA